MKLARRLRTAMSSVVFSSRPSVGVRGAAACSGGPLTVGARYCRGYLRATAQYCWCSVVHTKKRHAADELMAQAQKDAIRLALSELGAVEQRLARSAAWCSTTN